MTATTASWEVIVSMGGPDEDDPTSAAPDADVYGRDTYASWPEARRAMIEKLAGWLDDDCPTCRLDGTRALIDLALAPGKVAGYSADGRWVDWVGFVEGDGYLIVRCVP